MNGSFWMCFTHQNVILQITPFFKLKLKFIFKKCNLKILLTFTRTTECHASADKKITLTSSFLGAELNMRNYTPPERFHQTNCLHAYCPCLDLPGWLEYCLFLVCFRVEAIWIMLHSAEGMHAGLYLHTIRAMSNLYVFESFALGPDWKDCSHLASY